MKKVAIVGVEGSGKTVMLAGLGELYTHPDEKGFFLGPKNFPTASYVAEKIARMRSGEWPGATADDAMQGLDWALRRRTGAKGQPTDICEVSFLDFPGEVYRMAFGINTLEAGATEPKIVESLKKYIREADDLIVLINLRDVIVKGLGEPRVQEAMWITNEILSFALKPTTGRASPPRAAIVLSQADSYAETIRSCGGSKGVLTKYLPHVANNYDWLDIFAVSAVDKTKLDADGNVVPAPDFQPTGLKPVMEWIVAGRLADAANKKKTGCGCLMVKTLFFAILVAVGLLYLVPAWRVALEMRCFEMLDSCRGFICQNDANALYNAGITNDNDDAKFVFLIVSSAAHDGNVAAQCQLGWMFANGKGVERDDAAAVRWYSKSAGRGNPVAQNNLGKMYEEGRGVMRDVDIAVQWYRKAASQGVQEAERNLQRLGR